MNIRLKHRQSMLHPPVRCTIRSGIPLLSVVGLWLCLLGGMLALDAQPLYAGSEPCNPPNVIPQPVCDFDSFYGSPPRQLPNGWTEFIFSGDPTFMQDVDTYWGPPSLRIWSNGSSFEVGIYTQVGVTPGAGYRASIAWGAPNKPSSFGRQLGIDPTGGTDPRSPNVIWGPEHFGEGRILNYPPPDVNIDVKARAHGETMTVFFKVNHPYSEGDDLIFVDAIALYPDESAPQIEVDVAAAEAEPAPEEAAVEEAAAPAEAPVEAAAASVAVAPPAAVPTEVPFIPTNTPLPTATPTHTATPSPTPTQTATPSPSPTPTATPTATWTPWPTATSDQSSGIRFEDAQLQVANAARDLPSPLLLMVGLISLSGAGVCGGSLLWLRRRNY